MKENTMESSNINIEQAQKISSEIKENFQDLVAKAKEILNKNDLLRNAINNYGGLSMMLNEGFYFKAFSGGAINSRERIMAYDTFPLDGYLKANASKINLSNLDSLNAKFKERKELILAELAKQVPTDEEALKLAESIHTNLVLPYIDTEPIFG